MTAPPEREDWGTGEYIALSEEVLAPIFPVLARTALQQVPLPPDRVTVLDLGGGTGQWLESLARAGIRSGCLLDLAPEMVAHARRRWEDSGYGKTLSGIVGDADALPMRAGSFRLVVSRNSLHLWPDLERALAEVARVLETGGIAFLGRGYGPDLDPETRSRVKDRRKRLFEPGPDGREEPPSPEPSWIAELGAKYSLTLVKVLPDGKSCWVVLLKV